MEKIRRNERMSAMIEILSANPNKMYTLSYFCQLFGAAKSTMSEDVAMLEKVVETYGLGKIETIAGAAGGVRFRSCLSKEQALTFVEELSDKLRDKERVLPGGFLYLSDILSTPEIVEKMGIILAQTYYDKEIDFVLTMETKGIPVALMTARALGVPLVIARRSSKVYEGSAVNINYVSGSSNRIETMSLARRAIQPGERTLIVDDFLKAGGTAKGMVELMKEFEVDVVGLAFVISTAEPKEKRIHSQRSLMVLESIEKEGDAPMVHPSDWIKESDYE
ncbi:MAG: pur operon repressor [Clostridiales bacterium]|nr:pur operon repressor [Clostridiales bacterium]